MNRPNRKNVRAQWHQYGGGMYFITMCCKDMKQYFGHISNCKMNLSPLGHAVDCALRSVNEHHPYAFMYGYTVMPNHVHFIVFIDSDRLPKHLRDLKQLNTSSDFEQKRLLGQSWLSKVIIGIKSSVTRRARQLGSGFEWQSRYYDEIIFTREQFDKTLYYIIQNVNKWEDDDYHNDER